MSKNKCKKCQHEISEYENAYNNGMCYDCKKEEYRAERAEALQNDWETTVEYEDEVVCPYCGYCIEDEDGYYERKGNGQDKCPKCGKMFNFEVYIDITYSTSRLKGE